MSNYQSCCVSIPTSYAFSFQFLKNRIDFGSPVLSAPSRLQNLDEFYARRIKLVSDVKNSSSKANSMSNLTSKHHNQDDSILKSTDSLDSNRTPSHSSSLSEKSCENLPSPPKYSFPMFLPSDGKQDIHMVDRFDKFDPVELLPFDNDNHITFSAPNTSSGLINSECIPSGCNLFPIIYDGKSSLRDYKNQSKQLESQSDSLVTSRITRTNAETNINDTDNKNLTLMAMKVNEKLNRSYEALRISNFRRDSDDVQSDTDSSDDERSKQVVYRSYSDSTVHQRNRPRAKEKLKRMKSVHFADTSGYELEIHIPICKGDDYKVPPRLKEALDKIRAKANGKEDDQHLVHQRGGYNTLSQHYSLVLNFQQPFLEPTFQNRINQQNVCLESVAILPNSLSFTGVIRVNNLEFQKKVLVRYSTDDWKSFVDIPACYVASLADSHQDQFSFHVVVTSEDAKASGKIEIAVCYRLPESKRDFWDNNYRRNYVINCLEHLGNHCDDGMMS